MVPFEQTISQFVEGDSASHLSPERERERESVCVCTCVCVCMYVCVYGRVREEQTERECVSERERGGGREGERE